MKLSEIKNVLKQLDRVAFRLPNGEFVPGHFHVTEIGKIDKTFIDCGGTTRKEEVISFQLWESDDYDHRLHPEKLISIIELSEKVLELRDLNVEVEYQGNTIGKYDLDFEEGQFLLKNKFTTCLAKENCGIPEKPKLQLQNLSSATCEPGSGCC